MPLEGLQISRFRLLRLLGRGGMGEVYLAEDDQLRRQVAIKVIQTEYPDPDAARLFQREARAIAMLNHPHILPLFDFGEAAIYGTTLTYMVMPFCKEGTLATWMQQHRNASIPSPQDVGFIVQQAASALQYAHSNQIVHQDVKPSNFLIRSSEDAPGRPDLMLTDFGVAKFTSATASVSQSVRGTPTYMAPEQWEGTPVAATDQYALAIMAYDLLTGRPPFQGTLGQLMYQHIHVTPPPPGTLNPGLPADVDIVIQHALAKKPEDRFGSISAFARAFQQALPVDSSSLTLADTRREPGRSDIHVALSDPVVISSGPVTNSEGAAELASPRLLQEQSHESLTLADSKGIAELAPPSRATVSAKIGNRPPGLTTVLLVGLALLLAVGSIVGVLYFTRGNQQNITPPTTTSNTTQIPYPPFATLALDDPLSDNSHNNNWTVESISLGTCAFTGGAYHVNAIRNNNGKGCLASPIFGDFAYQVQMTTVKGEGGDILIRGDTKGDGYYFLVRQNGTYEFGIYKHCTNCTFTILRSASSSAINSGLNQSNLVAVKATGSTINLYVNNQLIDTVSDSSYSQGQIGVAATGVNGPTEVIFRNAKVWT